uniref:Uncharacterized protein n=1 Tax=Arundo donax TaxID=35708 RepID=A0A0A9GTT4_ARUDO
MNRSPQFVMCYYLLKDYIKRHRDATAVLKSFVASICFAQSKLD